MRECDENQWEKAFSAYCLDAAAGRLFRGLTHNINGVAQAFSMQTELLAMLFAQGGDLLAQVAQAGSLAEAQEMCRKLNVVMERRASLLVHLEREVGVIREIMSRCSGLVEAAAPNYAGPPFSLRTVIENELEFMKADSFFKHKVQTDLSLVDDIPLVSGFLVEIHQILAVFIENSAQGMQASFVAGQSSPRLCIFATTSGPQTLLSLSDNGEGITPELQAQMYEPFVSSRPGRLGIGLWLARRLAAHFAGTISCASVPGQTTFTLAIPHQGVPDVAC